MERLAVEHSPVDRSRERVERAMKDGRAHYGINTGFGVLAKERIGDEKLAELQQNLLLSHACGVGAPVPPDITRLMLQLKIHALGLGQSGISGSTFDQLLRFDRHGLTPWVPSKGSVGASGDLAPLAHMCLPLIGRGKVWDETETNARPAQEAMAALGIEPISLKAKDGLALINGTQLMAAYGAFVLERALVLQKEADILAAMSLEALQGSAAPFDERVHLIRPHPGQRVPLPPGTHHQERHPDRRVLRDRRRHRRPLLRGRVHRHPAERPRRHLRLSSADVPGPARQSPPPPLTAPTPLHPPKFAAFPTPRVENAAQNGW